jgi:thioester reductase-like protein
VGKRRLMGSLPAGMNGKGNQHQDAGAVLLTGTTGFVGMELLARYLERGDRPVYALVRAPDDEQAEARMRGTIDDLFGDPDAYRDRLTTVAGDIQAPGLGLDQRRREALAGEVSEIVHSAASVSFTLSLREARDINVAGTSRMLELADLCRSQGGLRRFSYISTAYVAGTHAGEFSEDQLDVGQSFRNTYEQSKFEAERIVHSYDDRLPIQVFRPSIVVGEGASGWTASFNVLYSPMKAFVRGALPALPARRSAPVDVVPVDYVADAVLELSSQPLKESTTYQLVAGPAATTVGRLIDLCARYLDRRQPLVIPPRLYTSVVYPLLRRSSAKLRRGLDRSRVFFPYFSMNVSYSDRRARDRLEPAGIRVPPIESYFERLLDYAVTAQWGRVPVSRADAHRRVGRPQAPSATSRKY